MIVVVVVAVAVHQVIVGIVTLIIVIKNTIFTASSNATASIATVHCVVGVAVAHCVSFRISMKIGSFNNIRSAAICSIFWIDCLSVDADCCV